ncbi:MAG: hypothetical protein AAF974_11530 [Cyanobacteria bacterium P01_E01_bin.34]
MTPFRAIAGLAGALVLSPIVAFPAFTQTIRLGEGIEFDLSEPEKETEYRVSTEDGKLDFEVYEREEPRTEIQLLNEDGSPGFGIRRTQREPEKKLDFSVPLR